MAEAYHASSLGLLVSAVQPVLVMVLIASAGFSMARAGLLDSQGRSALARMNFYVFSPALVFGTIASSVSVASLPLVAVLVANMSVAVLAGIAATRLIQRVVGTSPSLAGVFTCIAVFGNVGNLPLVFASAMCRDPSTIFAKTLGDSCETVGIAYASYDILAANLWQFTLGIRLMRPRPSPEPIPLWDADAARRSGSLPNLARIGDGGGGRGRLSGDDPADEGTSRAGDGPIGQGDGLEVGREGADDLSGDGLIQKSPRGGRLGSGASPRGPRGTDAGPDGERVGVTPGSSPGERKPAGRPAPSSAPSSPLGGESPGRRVSAFRPGGPMAEIELAEGDGRAAGAGNDTDGAWVTGRAAAARGDGEEADDASEGSGEGEALLGCGTGERGPGGAGPGPAAAPSAPPTAPGAFAKAHAALGSVDWASILPPPALASVVGTIIGCIPACKNLLYGPDPPLRFVASAIRALGNGLIPTGITLLGAVLAKGPGAGGVSAREIVAVVGCRLVLVPALLTPVLALLMYLKIFPFPDAMFPLTALLANATPTAVNIQTMAVLLGHGEQYVGSALFWCYLSAILTLPAWTWAYLKMITAFGG